jgi:hypothetical protein
LLGSQGPGATVTVKGLPVSAPLPDVLPKIFFGNVVIGNVISFYTKGIQRGAKKNTNTNNKE